MKICPSIMEYTEYKWAPIIQNPIWSSSNPDGKSFSPCQFHYNLRCVQLVFGNPTGFRQQGANQLLKFLIAFNRSECIRIHANFAEVGYESLVDCPAWHSCPWWRPWVTTSRKRGAIKTQHNVSTLIPLVCHEVLHSEMRQRGRPESPCGQQLSHCGRGICFPLILKHVKTHSLDLSAEMCLRETCLPFAEWFPTQTGPVAIQSWQLTSAHGWTSC